MSRNMYPSFCYKCGEYVPTGFGHFERHWQNGKVYWKVHCVNCASGRTVKESDPEVQRALRLREERERQKHE